MNIFFLVDYTLYTFLAWYLIQHYQCLHGLKMYKNCRNENLLSKCNNDLKSTRPKEIIDHHYSTKDSSTLDMNLAQCETAFHRVNPSNRSSTSSSKYASNQVTTAINSVRLTQQEQQSHLQSRRTKINSYSNSHSCQLTGINYYEKLSYFIFEFFNVLLQIFCDVDLVNSSGLIMFSDCK